MLSSNKNLNILTLESTRIKPVTLKFLYEFAAIPLTIRKEYLEKLLKRKNAHLQKNVRLLDIIYSHIAENTMLQWDENEICSNLDITRNMLYCHKSWLLKGLRAYYFKWNDDINKPEHRTVFTDFAKAEKLMEIGMRREAKSLFLNIINTLNKNKTKNRGENFLLFNSLKHLCDYYKSNRNYRKFIELYNAIETLSRKLIKEYPQKYSQIMMTIYLCRGYRTNFYGKKTQAALESIECLKSAYNEAEKINDIKEKANILSNLAGLLTAMNKLEECLEYTNKGLNLANENNMKVEAMFFETLLDLINVSAGKVNYNDLLAKITSRHKFIRNLTSPSYFWYQKIMFALASLSTQIGTPMTTRLLYEYTSREIVYDGYDSSLRILYFMKFDHYLEKIKDLKLQNDPLTGKEFIVCKRSDNNYLHKQETAIFELVVNARKIRDAPFKKELYLYMLVTDFWKGKNCSYEYSQHIMRHIDWINKNSPQLKEVNREILELSFLGISLIYDSKYLSRNSFLKKYEIKMSQSVEFILKLPPSKILAFYYPLSFIAEKSGNKVLKEMVRDAYFKLEQKYPQIFEEEKKAIRSRAIQEQPEFWVEDIAA